MQTFNTIVTIINTITASLACVFALIAVLQTRKELKESRKANITVKLVTVRHEDVCLHLENIGGSAAQNVILTFSGNLLEKLEDFRKERFTKLYKDGFSLSQDQSIYYSLGHISEFSNMSNEKLIIDISYLDIYKEKHLEKIEIDFSAFDGSMIYTSPEDDIVYSLKEIKTAISNRSTNMNGIPPITQMEPKKEF